METVCKNCGCKEFETKKVVNCKEIICTNCKDLVEVDYGSLESINESTIGASDLFSHKPD
jgi:hypothetical protein